MTAQEAVLSSKIEGTQATLGEVLEFEAEGELLDESTPKKADIREVLNYRSALREGTALLQTLPLSQRVVLRTHDVLMQGVRGRNKAPGEYRRVPNWIGPAGCQLDDARFVPCPADKLRGAMSMWEAFVHAPHPDLLVQLAILHAEFEAIHPFLDGNGRLGRLIIPLFLFEKRLLSRPNFYLSEYLEANRAEYYQRLLDVSDRGDWTGWCVFFLQAIIAQAAINQAKAAAIIDLYGRRKDWISGATFPICRSGTGLDVRSSGFPNFGFCRECRHPRADRHPHHPCRSRSRHVAGNPSGEWAAGRRFGFCRTPEHRRRTGCVLIIIGDWQKTLSITEAGFVIDKIVCRAYVIHNVRPMRARP